MYCLIYQSHEYIDDMLCRSTALEVSCSMPNIRYLDLPVVGTASAQGVPNITDIN